MKLDRITLRMWKALKWRDPRTDLVNLGKLQGKLPDATVDSLRRDRDLKWAVEQRQAALFSYLISCAVPKSPIAYAMSEESDYDCVLWWKVDGKSRYAPVQLKEVAPSRLDPTGSIEKILEKLAKYRDTVVAIHVNRSGLCSSIRKPQTSVAEIWLYSSLTADQSLWGLYGDLLNQPQSYEIPWPRSQ